MRASIIIPAFNAEGTLARCLSACMAQDFPDFEVLVVDDGSTDATGGIVAEFPSVRLIRQANQGPAAARNHGAREATGDVLVFTDSDCVPCPDWLSRLLAGFDASVAAIGGTYACANPASRLARVIQAEIGRRHAQFGDGVDFLGSFNVAYRAEAFRAAGGFDESYRQASGEDNDLAYRLQDAGGTLCFTTAAVVAHYHPERLIGYLRTQARHGYWRVKLYREHPGWAKGDQYAGWPDLLAPPLGLLLLCVAPAVLCLQMIGWYAPAVACGFFGLVAAYVALHLPITWRLRRDLSPADLLYFCGMASLRDLARALGLVRGVWRFAILARRA